MVVQRDRSGELHQLFDSIRSVQAPVEGRFVPPARASAPPPEMKVFNDFAQVFAREIASVSENIMSLTKLMQRQTVFDDDSQEIASLTGVVKASLQRLHNDLETLVGLREHAMRAQRGSSWTLSPQHCETERHTDTVVDTLRSRLVRTGQQFKTVLQQRTRTLKDTASRRNKFTSDRATSFESALFRDQEQQAQQQLAVASNTQYYRQRYEAVREVEAAVAEVGELFQDFTRLVHEQEELVVRIDANVDDALTNVNAGSYELMRYLATISSNRGLILKLFAVLAVFVLFFGFVVVR